MYDAQKCNASAQHRSCCAGGISAVWYALGRPHVGLARVFAATHVTNVEGRHSVWHAGERTCGISAGHASRSAPRDLLEGGASAKADLPRQPPALMTASRRPPFSNPTAWKRFTEPAHTYARALV